MSINNKWMRGAVPALLFHCSIGSVYAWSLFVGPISEHIGAEQSAVQFSFSLAIFFLGLSAAFAGRFVETNIKRSSLISALFFSSGLLVTAGGLALKSLPLIYLGYGCVMGIGLGIGYITPVKTLMMWFEDNKGLATGIAIMGFGLASTIASPLITFLLGRFTIETTFIALAGIYLVPTLLGHLLLKKPYADVQHEGDRLQPASLLKNRTAVLTWLMFFLSIHCGLALISTAAPLMKEAGIAAATIAAVVSVMGIFNAGGRLVFATASDRLHDRSAIYRVIFSIALALVVATIVFKVGTAYALLLIAISAAYGAGFSCLPPLLSDEFGMTNLSQIHGLMLTAWAVAGLTGNQMASLIQRITGEFANVVYALLPLYGIALVIAWALREKRATTTGAALAGKG